MGEDATLPASAGAFLSTQHSFVFLLAEQNLTGDFSKFMVISPAKERVTEVPFLVSKESL